MMLEWRHNKRARNIHMFKPKEIKMFTNHTKKWQLSFLVVLLLLLAPAGRGYTVYAAAEDQLGQPIATPVGTFGGIAYVKYDGIFEGQTSTGTYRVPYRIGDQAATGLGHSRREELPWKHSAEDDDRVRHSAGRHLRQTPEHHRQNHHRQERSDDGPGRSGYRLLVANQDVSPGQEVEQLPVAPEVLPVLPSPCGLLR